MGVVFDEEGRYGSTASGRKVPMHVKDLVDT